MSERKLEAWQAAGLIDGDTAARIRAWEAEHARPIGLWAVFGIAALAIGLGIVSVVAANWDEIAGEVRLALHSLLMVGIAAYLWLRAVPLAEKHPWLHEAMLFILGALGLAFMGHVGQVYQTSSPLWQPLALWLVLFAPLLLLEGLSWLTAAMVAVAIIYTGWDFAIDTSGEYGEEFSDNARVIRMSLAINLAVLLTGLGAWMRAKSAREAFWVRLEQLGLIYGVGLASLVAIVCVFESWTTDEHAAQIALGLAIGAAIGLAAAGLVWRARIGPSGEAQAGILAGASASALLAFILSGNTTAAGVLFMLLWAGIAFAALHAGWRGTFQFAVGVIALRLIVLSFELGGDLLLSGVGLIVSGLMILGIAFAAVRVSKEYAPRSGEAA